MTIDGQHLANEFDAAFEAIRTMQGGLIACRDGTMRSIPAHSTSPTPGGVGAHLFKVEVEGQVAASMAARQLAQSAARQCAEQGRGHFFRLPHNGDDGCFLSEPHKIPCRVTLIGHRRQVARIEIGLRG